MDRHAPGINSGYAGGSYNCYLFRAMLFDIFQKRRFAGTCFTCQENVARTLVDQVEGKFEFLICSVWSDVCHELIFIQVPA